jgi:hypothetical protein
VYIQEAHTSDGWQVDDNCAECILVDQPVDFETRRALARQCCEKLGISIPCAVDTMDNAVDNLYAGFPERMFVINAHGRVAYAGGIGPWGFKPEDAEVALLSLPGMDVRTSARD